MNTSDYQRLVETAARRELHPGEREQLEDILAQSPQLEQTWRDDQRLSRVLKHLPDVELAPNFTSQVLRRVETLEARPRQRAGPLHRWLFHVGRRWSVAIVGLLVVVAFTAHWQYQARSLRQLAQSVASLPVEGVSNVRILRDFDQILVLDARPRAGDDELLKALQ